LFIAFALPVGLSAANYPLLKEADWIIRDFRFSTGEILPELRIHYTTVGNPTGEPVLILHGTNRSGSVFLLPQHCDFAVVPWAEILRFLCQSDALIVRKSNPLITQLFPKDSVFLTQIF